MRAGPVRFLAVVLFTGLSILSITPAPATTYTVNQVGLTFDPADLTVNVGDTVTWVWSSGSHTVTNGVDLADPDLGTLFDEPLDSGHTPVSFTFTHPGEVPYLCRIHVSFGMTGIVRVATGVTHTVDQIELTFVPDDIDINVGDSVEWIWSSGIHTVTNGADLSDPELGLLFDAPLDANHTTFSYTFFSGGDVPYVCVPHVIFGMTGVVHVHDLTPVNEPPGRAGFALHQNNPNPFNPQTVIRYSLPLAEPVSLRVYDLAGRIVRVLQDGNVLEAGDHQVVWNGRDDQDRPQATGVYFYRLETPSGIQTRTMALVK